MLAILWGSLYSVRDAMNAESAEQSQRLLDGRAKALQEQVSLIASDYHNWTDIFLNAQDLDYGKLSSNYGITAARGDVFQYAELYDGPFASSVAWLKGRGLAPQEGFVDEATKAALRERVRRLDIGNRDTTDYFEMRDGQLATFSSSYLLPEDSALLADLVPESQAIAVIGKVITSAKLDEIATEFSARNLKLVDAPLGIGTVSVPMIGIFGEPVAWLEWNAPKPGTILFWKMVPIMAVVSLLFSLGFYWGARLLSDKAYKLVAQEAISFQQARTDALTGLPNRLALREHLAKIAADGTLNCAMVAIDLDRFKQVNDTVGHLGGDEFLEAFAERLRKLSEGNTFVARFGGDEFVLILSSREALEEKAAQKCIALEQVLRERIVCNGIHFDVPASKGLGILRASEFCEDELLRRADRALYAAKARGRQKVIAYDERMEAKDREHRAIEDRLRRALADGKGFYIEYQPIVSMIELHSKRRFEALARWRCSDVGEIRPDKFIPVAEASGLIVRLGWLLLDLICHDIKDLADIKVSLNISPAQLMTPGYAELFTSRVKANGVRPEQIEVEITEQIVLRDDVTVAQELTILRDHGFSLALDDFGTGYSSIGYLTRMPFDVLKIDRSFAKLRTDRKQGKRMVHSMVGLGHAMGLTIIAEGIETLDQAEHFRDLSVDFMQGFYFGRPDSLTASLSRGHSKKINTNHSRQLAPSRFEVSLDC